MKIFVARLVLVLFLFITGSTVVNAQCAMCKATIKENVEKGEGVGQGINKGILYLMAIPYVAFGVVAYLWYKNSKQNVDKKNFLDRMKSRYFNNLSSGNHS